MHESTVMRRLNALEKQLGTRLFERFPTGYIAMPAGEEICRTAQQMMAFKIKVFVVNIALIGEVIEMRGLGGI